MEMLSSIAGSRRRILSFTVFVMSKLLLIVTAMVEVATGVALLIAPSLVVELLLGEGLSSPQSLVLGRVTGAALISIGVACWLSSKGESSGHRALGGRHADLQCCRSRAPDSCRDRFRDAQNRALAGQRFASGLGNLVCALSLAALAARAVKTII